VSHSVISFSMFFTVRSFNPSPNPQAEGPPFVVCLRLLIQYSRRYHSYLVAVSSIRNPWTRHVVVTGTHITWNRLVGWFSNVNGYKIYVKEDVSVDIMRYSLQFSGRNVKLSSPPGVSLGCRFHTHPSQPPFVFINQLAQPLWKQVSL